METSLWLGESVGVTLKYVPMSPTLMFTRLLFDLPF
jgi:hypothetical protein